MFDSSELYYVSTESSARLLTELRDQINFRRKIRHLRCKNIVQERRAQLYGKLKCHHFKKGVRACVLLVIYSL